MAVLRHTVIDGKDAWDAYYVECSAPKVDNAHYVVELRKNGQEGQVWRYGLTSRTDALVRFAYVIQCMKDCMFNSASLNGALLPTEPGE